VRAQHLVLLDDAGRGARHVVVVGPEEARVLGGLAADERRAGRAARLGDTAHDVGDALGVDLARGDVVGHEQRLRARHDDVIDDHAHEVLPDRVVLVEGLRDRDLRAHAVGARREQRVAVLLQEGCVVQTGETTHAAENLGAVGGLDGRFHELDGEIAGCCVDSGFGVRRTGRFGGRSG
jgi:hypothetical protein